MKGTVWMWMFCMIGCVAFVIRMLHGGMDIDQEELNRIQFLMELTCVLTTILMVEGAVRSAVKNEKTDMIVFIAFWIVFCAVFSFLIPDDIKEDPAMADPVSIFILLATCPFAMMLTFKLEKRWRLKKHPDGFILSFWGAFRIAKNGGRCVCETGNCMGPPLGEGSPGPVRLKWPVTAQELGARWREIDEDQTDDQRREGGHRQQDCRCPDDCRGPVHHAIIVQDGPGGRRVLRRDLREMRDRPSILIRDQAPKIHDTQFHGSAPYQDAQEGVRRFPDG